MAGLLTRAIAGAVKGAGDSMIEKAKQEREDALLAAARANAATMQKNEFDHSDASQQAGFTHADQAQERGIGAQKDLQSNQQEFQGGENQKNRDFQGTQTDKEIGAHHQDLQTSEAGSDRRNKATIDSEDRRNKENNEGRKAVAEIRANATVERLAQAGGKALTYNQAFNMAMQAYKTNLTNSPEELRDADGQTIPANVWAERVASGYVEKYGAKDNTATVRGGGLLNPNPSGGGPSFAVDPSKLDFSNSAPSLSMPSSSGLTPRAATGTQGNGGPARLSQSDALSQAQAAIAAGAPKASVIQRLKQNGYDPSGL